MKPQTRLRKKIEKEMDKLSASKLLMESAIESLSDKKTNQKYAAMDLIHWTWRVRVSSKRIYKWAQYLEDLEKEAERIY